MKRQRQGQGQQLKKKNPLKASRFLTTLCLSALLLVDSVSCYSIPSISISTPFRSNDAAAAAAAASVATTSPSRSARKQQQQQQHRSFGFTLPQRQRKVRTKPQRTSKTNNRRLSTTTITTTTTAPPPTAPTTTRHTPPVPSSSHHHLPTEAWAAKYTSVDALREAFGANKNHVWGDLDPCSARKLYKSLLPKALFELHQYYSHQLASKHPSPELLETVATDLAPLAYQARVAAKLYARERCRLPARVAANLYDGFRQWRKYGKFQVHGMSYEQVWDKYAQALDNSVQDDDADDDTDASEEVLAAKIGLKILERACATNPVVDRLVLKDEMHATVDSTTTKQEENDHHHHHQQQRQALTAEELQHITAQLEQDVQQLLWPVLEQELHLSPSSSTTNKPDQKKKHYRMLRQLALMKRSLNRLSLPFHETAPTPLIMRQQQQQVLERI